VTHKSPGVDYSTLFPSWFTLSVETYAPNNASDPPLDENSTDFPLTMLTITDTIDIENGSHSMSNSEKGKSNLDLNSSVQNMNCFTF